MKTEELKIPVPWGSLAAKAWGESINPPVVLLHGLQDNANSFNRLIPLLPRNLYYVCLDQPGHGKSSALLTSTLPSYWDFILAIKLLLDHLDRKKYILMGHSFGGRNATFFTQMYPDYVEKLIMLDATYYIPTEPENCFQLFKGVFKEYEKQIRKKGEAPTYYYDEAVERMRNARYSDISKDTAEMMMERSLIPVGDNKYKISTAQNLKYLTRFTMSTEYVVRLFETHPVQCPHLLIMAAEGESNVNQPVLEVLKQRPNCRIYIVEGEHDVHVENPQVVAPFISDFLLNFKSKL